MTPAKRAGLVVGQQYKLKPGSSYQSSWSQDFIFTFKEDDGSDRVMSLCPIEYNADGCAYLDVSEVIACDSVSATPSDPVGFSMSVSEGKTAFLFDKTLTVDQVAAVFKAAGL